MDIELIFDVNDIPECTVLQNVREEGSNYVGIWASFRGSYEVAVPIASCKPYVPDTIVQDAAKLDLVGTADGHIKLSGAEAVRCRVLDRWMIGRSTNAPIGVGNYTPGAVKVLLISEQTSHPEKNRYHAPFCSTKACSGWLNKQLCEADISERKLFWVNALDNDGSFVDLGAIATHLKPERIFALGKIAEARLAVYNLTYTAFAHPQFWKRFKSKEPYPLIKQLKAAIL